MEFHILTNGMDIPLHLLLFIPLDTPASSYLSYWKALGLCQFSFSSSSRSTSRLPQGTLTCPDWLSAFTRPLFHPRAVILNPGCALESRGGNLKTRWYPGLAPEILTELVWMGMKHPDDCNVWTEGPLDCEPSYVITDISALRTRSFIYDHWCCIWRINWCAYPFMCFCT